MLKTLNKNQITKLEKCRILLPVQGLAVGSGPSRHYYLQTSLVMAGMLIERYNNDKE